MLRLWFCTPVLNDYFEKMLGFKCLAKWWIQMRNAYLLSNSLLVSLCMARYKAVELQYHQTTLFKCYCCTKVNVFFFFFIFLSEKYCFLICEGNSFLGSKDSKNSHVSKISERLLVGEKKSEKVIILQRSKIW